MGRYLVPGHQYVDGQTVTGPSLTEHVEEATFKTTAVTEQTLKDPAALTDQLLVVASGAFFQQTLQQIHDLILYPGSVVQTAYAEYTANSNLSAVIPDDDTIPQNTEGTEIINLSITPRFATSTILLSFEGIFDSSAPVAATVALFRDSLAPARAARGINNAGSARIGIQLKYMDSPATTSATAYKIRVGPASGTIRMNGSTAQRYLGGSQRTTLTIQEIKA